MGALGYTLILLISASGISMEASSQESSYETTGSPLPSGNMSQVSHQIIFPSTSLSGSSEKDIAPTMRPTIDQQYIVSDCYSWINPLENPEIPSGITKIPVTIGVANNKVIDGNFSLVIINKYADQLACFTASYKSQETPVSIYLGKCGEGEPEVEGVWPSLTSKHGTDWPGLEPHTPFESYFHIGISAKENKNQQGTTQISFKPNGDYQKTLSVNVESSAEFVHIYATRIETVVNQVSFFGDCIASKCSTLAEPVRWNQTAYFLPENRTNQVKLTFEYCQSYDTLTYLAPSEEIRWHTLTFGQDLSADALDNILFYRNVFIDDSIVGNLTITNEHNPVLLRVIKMCPLEEARVTITNAVWTHRCNPTNTALSISHQLYGSHFIIMSLFLVYEVNARILRN